MPDENLGMTGSEGSLNGQSGMSLNSAVGRDRVRRDGQALGEAIASGMASKLKALFNSIFSSALRDRGGGGVDGAASPTGTKYVGNLIGNASYFSQRMGEEKGVYAKTKFVGNTISALRKAGAAEGAEGAAASRAGMAAVGVGLTVAGTRMAVGAAQARFDRAREGVLEADRMSVLYQQMTGLSQLGVSSKYRMPLTQYRLGAGGINTLMSMQAQTGLSAIGQASSVEALRTMSGYQMSAGDATSMIASLSSAPTVNRMFMMTGTSLIGPGGTERSGLSVIQNLVRQAGLTTEESVSRALLPGSPTRARLRTMGVPEEMITQVIQYAQQNLTYQKRGGQGMYNPASKDARKKMGIEGNFATQVEETQRLETKRDEKFYRRQVDNFSDLERQTQKLTQVFGALEDKLSGIIGAIGGNRLATSAFMSATAPMGGAFGGDPSSATSDATTSVPTYGSGKKSLNEIKNMTSFRNMHPRMQERLLKMMRDNPNVGFGQGVRSSQAQRSMFLQRYRKTDKETNAQGKKNLYWDGSYWEHVSGAPAAPPGRSMHEIGLAADLVGDTDWVVKNAHRYGLKHFKGVNNEPWHVQPVELPNSRRAYEEGGTKWGSTPPGAAPYEPDSDFADSLDRVRDSGHGGVQDDGKTFGTSEPYGLSISQRVSQSITGTSGGRAGEVVAEGNAGTPVNKKRVDKTLIRRGRLTGEQVAMLLHGAGFRGQDIIKGVAISERESRWNSMAHNPNRATGDNSYGLFQINMIEKYAAGRRKAFGIASNEELFEPEKNVKATKQMYDGRKNKGNGWYDWGPYKGKSETYNTDVAKATRIVNSIDFSGDPMGGTTSSGTTSGSGSVSVVGGATFNIAPTINMGGNSSSDLQRMAKEIALMVKREIEIEVMRSS